ncbi:MAG TPA: hypothetical protein VM305_10670 [Candidatus Limnocylindrales bacterium]|nr:hypothetical protein [Candidatus Limnocylindrales bacterium]
MRLVEGPALEPDADEPEVHDPVTYFEALTGRRDPHREWFIAARRVLFVLGWVVTLAPMVLLLAAGLLSGESFETIFFMGLFGAIIGAFIRSSLPRTPFD